MLLTLPIGAALAQGPGGPPSVGVVRAEPRPMTESTDFIGRVAAIDRVTLTARVTAFLTERRFVEGAEVEAGALLFRLDRQQFDAELARQNAVLAEAQAKLANANIQLARVQSLVGTPADRRAAVDDAIAGQRAAAAQAMSAQAQLRLAEINLGYTEITAPVAGKIGRAAVTVGNVVGPSVSTGGGVLATIVSQDPMYVLFPVATRVLAMLERRQADMGGLRATKIRLRLPDGSVYDQVGTIDFVEPTVAANTDTVTLRARIANPVRRQGQAGQPVDRTLIDGTLVTVVVEGAAPIMTMAIPRATILSDQQGSYVYVVGPDNKVEQRRVVLGQSTPALAIVADGLKDGDNVILEGIQRARPGLVVAPSPAVATPATATR